MHSAPDVEQWSICELELTGPATGNPFQEVELGARFTHKHRSITVDGFYDGDGVYRVRFMPDAVGTWTYCTTSSASELDQRDGTFTCTPAVSEHNHGPVRVANTYHFAYADGMPYKQIGTTCYAWTHQGDQLEEQTIETLRSAPFNKMRMCVFPKSYDFNHNEPEHYPFPLLTRGSSEPIRFFDLEPVRGWSFDWSRFEPAFFRHLEQRIGDLMRLGIEADLILFHPYDRWGFIRMDADTDDRYLRYIVARLAAYRNIWWSMANEWDLARNKTVADWDRYFRIVQESDPYDHLRSIHNCFVMYDHSRSWVTHQSIQHSDLAQVSVWREQHRKPVVVDECCYEGNIPHRWGNITAEEMVRRFWEGTVQGGYVGHGDTFLDPQDILWWSKGGVLRGQSAPRLAFLGQVLEDSPAEGIDPVPVRTVIPYFFACAGREHRYYLTYFGVHRPARMRLDVPEGEHYSAEIIDTWEMTTTPVAEPVVRGSWVDLPERPYLALVLRRSD